MRIFSVGSDSSDAIIFIYLLELIQCREGVRKILGSKAKVVDSRRQSSATKASSSKPITCLPATMNRHL